MVKSEWIHPDKLKYYHNGERKPVYEPKESVDDTALNHIKEKIRR